MAASTKHPSEHPPVTGPRAWLEAVRHAILGTPHLTLIAGLAGFTLWLLVMYYQSRLALGASSRDLQVDVASSEVKVREFVFEFATATLQYAALLLSPAFLLAWFRRKTALDLIAPVMLVCFGLLAYWLLTDIQENYLAVKVSNLGEEPSLAAYYFKLIVTGAAILSPPVMIWFYGASTILDRHVIRTFLAPFMLCFLGLMMLLVIFDLFDNGPDLFSSHMSGWQILTFYIIQLPKFLVFIVDLSLLLALLYALSRMSRYNEIISMISAGRSVWRILLPLLVAGSFATLISLACNYQWAPEADRKKEDMLKLAGEKDLGAKARKSKTAADRVAYFNNATRRLWYLHLIPIDLSSRNPIKDVEIHEYDIHGNQTRAIYAAKAFWKPETPPVWVFREVCQFVWPEATAPAGAATSSGLVPASTANATPPPPPPRTNGPEPTPVPAAPRGNLDAITAEFGSFINSQPRKILSDELVVEAWPETPWRLMSESGRTPAEFLSVPQLTSYLNTNRDFSSQRLAPYLTWWHDRLARPLRCLVVVLFAAPLGIVFSRRGLMGSVASSILLYFGMYFLTIAFIRFGETSKMSPILAAWMVNIVFGTIGLLLLWQRSSNRDLGSFFSSLAFWKKA